MSANPTIYEHIYIAACPGFFIGAEPKSRKSRPKAESGVGLLGRAASPLLTS